MATATTNIQSVEVEVRYDRTNQSQLAKQAPQLSTELASIQIQDQQSLDSANQLIMSCDQWLKAVDRIMDPVRDATHKAWKAAIGAQDECGLPQAGGDAHHPPECPDPAGRQCGASARHQLANSGLGRLRGLEIYAGRGIFAACACCLLHASARARGTWVRSWKARTRDSTSARVTWSRPRIPNCSTAYDPIAAPYTIARRKLSSVTVPVRAR